jgi:hypothetical protein
LVGDMTVVGEWVDRDTLRPALRAAVRKNKIVAEAAHSHNISFQLTPLPCWSKLDAQTLRAKHQALVDDVVNAAKAARGAILASDRHDAPRESSTSPAPLCHTTAEAIRSQFRRAYTIFKNEYRKAAAYIRESWATEVNLRTQNVTDKQPATSHYLRGSVPPGCYLTAMRFIPPQSSFLSSIVRLPDG